MNDSEIGATLMKLTYTMVFILVNLLISQSATSNPAKTGGLCDVKAEEGEVVSYRSCEELILTTKKCHHGDVISSITIGDGTNDYIATMCDGYVEYLSSYTPEDLVIYVFEGQCDRGLKAYSEMDVWIEPNTYRACVPESKFVYNQLRYSDNSRPIIRFFMGNVCPTGSVADLIIEEWDDQLPAVGCKPSLRSLILGGS